MKSLSEIEIDHEAMSRAIAIKNKRQRAHDVLRNGETQIERKLKDEPWEEVGSFAAYSCQMKSLGLRPWEWPPCWVGLDDRDPEHSEAVKLLRRLLDAGLSRFEPDPIKALQAIEARAS